MIPTDGPGLLLFVLAVLFGAVILARVITMLATRSATVQCPSCKERVKKGATKCRFCGSAITAAPDSEGF